MVVTKIQRQNEKTDLIKNILLSLEKHLEQSVSQELPLELETRKESSWNFVIHFNFLLICWSFLEKDVLLPDLWEHKSQIEMSSKLSEI